MLNEGGTLTSAGGQVTFQDCDALTLLLGAGTDYVMDYGRHWRARTRDRR